MVFKWLWFCCHFKQLKFSVLVTAHKTLTINTHTCSVTMSPWSVTLADPSICQLPGNKPSASPVWTHWSPLAHSSHYKWQVLCLCCWCCSQRSDGHGGPWRSDPEVQGKHSLRFTPSSDHSCEGLGMTNTEIIRLSTFNLFYKDVSHIRNSNK